ncbi:CoA pyrophosphatase [Evansella sp. AB-P1]|uniref:NUDIX hydrolase n=1 Tax=Evansella sp. AB-P1 TaxID=3037653 RepID=UPI00241DCE1D|nr:CoA pyrophosphatase [Evansella sp. AB-P1]MDG5786489.1 CoA pyrophosphatase [Evansella sp. AB-P1]
MNFNDQSVMNHFRKRKANIIDYETYIPFALFVPLIEKDGELTIIFEVRAQNIRQPGEICFPGGKVDDEDRSYSSAAVRELSEELGVETSNIELLGELDYMVTPFKLILYPFLGKISSDATIEKNDAEVKEVLYIPLSTLLKMKPKEHHVFLKVMPEESFPYHLIPNGENYNWRTGKITEQFYEYEGHVIWGLTARILTHVLDEIRKVTMKE